MTREQAVRLLKGKAYVFYGEMQIKALGMAIEALQQDEIIRCEDCKHHGTSNCPMWGNDTTEDYMWCCDGERKESDGE